MLTEIEWWGGMLFIWMAFSYSLIFKEFKDLPKLEIGFLSTSLAFLAAAALLALYFYTLERQILKHVYLGTLALGLVFTTLMYVVPESELMKEKVAKREANDEEEELDFVYEVLGQILFAFPVFASFALAVYKAWGVLPEL